jgi:hypothetical protein
MLKISSISLLAIIVLASLCVEAHQTEANAGYCAGRLGGKCPTPKKISKSRSDFTSEQRKKLLEEARQVCIRKYGASSSVYSLDYKKWRVICRTPGM